LALTPEQSDALIREVDDAVRQDDFYGFWRRYGRIVIGLLGASLLGFGAWLMWTNHQNKAAEASSEDFAVMMKSASAAQLDQASLDKIAKSGSDGYRTEAELVKAAVAAGKQDIKGALASYDKVIADKSTPEPLRQLAIIRRTALNFDSMPPQQVVDALRPLAVPGNPWFGSAGEMTALAYIKMNKRREAGDMFASVNRDATVTESIRQRAGQMAGVLGVAPESIANIEGAQ
jgi:hypothetical protein